MVPDSTCLSFDEAGRGALAGPVAIACVSFSLNTIQKIRDNEILLGIRDSKILSLEKRLKLRSEILKYADYAQTVLVSQKFIDRYNINQAIFYGINRLIPERISSRSRLEFLLLVDGNYTVNIQKQVLGIQSIPKGDDLIPSISAASILAKTTRDEFMEAMDRKFKDYGFASHKGYGTEMHRMALEKFGISSLHRLSFCGFLRKDEGEPNLFS